MKLDVFISYPSPNKTQAEAVCAALEDSGLQCWIAPRDIMPGLEYGHSLVEAIDRCRVMLLIFSAHTNNSAQIVREVDCAVTKRVPLVPMRIENVIPVKSFEYYLSSVHWLDAYTPPLEKHFQRLIAALKALLQTPIEDGKAAVQFSEPVAAAPKIPPSSPDSTSARPKRGKAPPTPQSYDAFRKWLTDRPREWSMTIAARATLRVLPLSREAADVATIIVPLFRAAAIVRFASKYPDRDVAAAANAARDAVAEAAATAANTGADIAAYACYAAESTTTVVAARSAAVAAVNAADCSYSTAAATEKADTLQVRTDAARLHDELITSSQLARAALWNSAAPDQMLGAWERLARELRGLGAHWSVWIDWYNRALAGAEDSGSEAWDAAFTDIPGSLPWDDGAEAVNAEIVRRLSALGGP